MATQQESLSRVCAIIGSGDTRWRSLAAWRLLVRTANQSCDQTLVVIDICPASIRLKKNPRDQAKERADRSAK